MSQSRNLTSVSQPEGRNVTFTLSDKELSMVPNNIAIDQAMLNDFGRRSLLWNCGLIAQASGQSDLAYVDLAISETMNSFATEAQELPDAFRTEIEDVVGVDEGQAFEPVYTLLTDASDTLVDAATDLAETWCGESFGPKTTKNDLILCCAHCWR